MPAKGKKRATPIPKTILREDDNALATPSFVFAKRAKSGNFVISPEVHEKLSEFLNTADVSKKLFGGPTRESNEELESSKVLEANLKLRRRAKLQDKRAEKIKFSLKAHDAMEAARCLHEIEKAHRQQGDAYDVDAMVQTARDKASETIQQLIDGETVSDYEDWITLCIDIMRKLFAGDQYTTALKDTVEARRFDQGKRTVAEYIDIHAPSLRALLRAYERDDAITIREQTQMEAHFVTRWINGLAPHLRTTLPSSYAASLMSEGDRMSFDTVCQKAQVEEKVRRNDAAPPGKKPFQPAIPSAAAATPSGVGGAHTAANGSGGNDISKAIQAVGSLVETATSALANVAGKFASRATPNAAPFQSPGNKKTCYHCQRKGLPYEHDHLFCPVRLTAANARGAGGQAKPNFNPAPPEGPPPGLPAAMGRGIASGNGGANVCFRCGAPGHRANTCDRPCKVCKLPGKMQHAQGCPNAPRWMRHQGNGPPARF